MSSPMLQLNPPIPLWHVRTKQPCDAMVLIDYSQEHDLVFVCIMRDGEIWSCRNSELRGQENMTLGRPKSEMVPRTYVRSAGGAVNLDAEGNYCE